MSPELASTGTALRSFDTCPSLAIKLRARWGRAVGGAALQERVFDLKAPQRAPCPTSENLQIDPN
jgi:hypothetical protein